MQNILETDDDEDDEAIYSSSRGELASIDPQVYFQEQFSGDEDDEDDEDDHFDKWGAGMMKIIMMMFARNFLL